MILLRRGKQLQLNVLSNLFKRCHFQNNGVSPVSQNTSIGIMDNQSLAILKTISEFGNNVRFFASPVQVKQKYEEKDKSIPRMNEQIFAPYVRLVTDQGHGVVSRHDALAQARRLNVDLVEVQPDGKPPVCKLMDYNKERYLRQVKEKEQAKNKSELVLRKGALKEVRITCKIDKNDLQTKADGVRRLTERGHRVKCMAMGTADQNLGGLLSRLSVLIDDFTLVESGPIVEAKQAYIVVRHVKFGPLKKGPGKKNILAQLNANTSTQSPENFEQNLDENEPDLEESEAPEEDLDTIFNSSSTNVETLDHMKKFAPETPNRYASTRQTNASAPRLENRYASSRQTSASASPSENRYASASGSDARNLRSQIPINNPRFDSNIRKQSREPRNDFQRDRESPQVNRYKK